MNLSRQKSKSLKASVPYFSQRLSDGEAVVGGAITLQCKVDGYPRPEIQWERDGQLIGRSRNIQTNRNGERCILELRNIRELDSGTYRCTATNINGKASTQCYVLLAGMTNKQTSTGKTAANLKLPRNVSMRSRSAERENPRIIWRSNSLSGRLKNSENNIHNNVACSALHSRRSNRPPLSIPKNVLQKLNPNNLYREGLQSPTNELLVRNSFGKPLQNTKFMSKSANDGLSCELTAQKPSKSISNKSKFTENQNKDNSQPNAKRTRNDLLNSKYRPMKCSKQADVVPSHAVPIKNQEHQKPPSGIIKSCHIKVIVNDASKVVPPSVETILLQSPPNVPQTRSSYMYQNGISEDSKKDLMSTGFKNDEDFERSLLNHINGSLSEFDPPAASTGFESTNYVDIVVDDGELDATPTTDSNAKKNAANEIDLKQAVFKRLPEITIDVTKDEDEDEANPLDTCTCNCHQKERTKNVLGRTTNGNIRYSADVTENTPEEFPLEDQTLYDLVEASVTPQRSNSICPANSPLTICTRSSAKILRGPVSVTVRNGEKVTLSTSFFGSPPNEVRWTKGGTVIVDGGPYSVLNGEFESELVIHCVTADDSGKYVFTVENDFGGDSCFASVAVLGFPKPPGGPPTPSDFTDHSLVLSWYGSMFDGGSVLTGYLVEMCHVPGRQWQTATTCVDTSCVVDGLSLGQRYVFRVRARNRFGQSEPSGETQTICLEDYQTENEEKDENDELPNNIITIQKFADFMDRYDLKEEVGRGKFGKVHRCVDKYTGLPRAAKMIRCRKCKDRTDVHREIEVMKRLRHPKLLRIAGAFESDKMMVMVTEYVSGGELFQRVIMDDFVLTESDCILFMRQICDAVDYMHKCSVLHLDLKPENILCKTRTSHQIKIIDFGLSTFYNPKESLCILFGTPEFVAPEVIAFEPVGPASDMWSVGVICYVLLSGLSPFLGESESETFANITRGVIDFDEEEFDKISADAKNFISDIVIKNPRRRMSAAEALNHSWLKRAYWLEDYPPLSTEKLKKFIIRRKWQKSGTAIRALRRFVTLSRSSAESLGELTAPATPISPAPTDSSEDSGIFQDSGCFDFPN